MEKYFLTLSNNVIILGTLVSENDSTFTLGKPYMVVNDGSQVLLIPYLTDIINQETDEMVFLKSNVINVVKADTNTSLVRKYVETTTGIKAGEELILG